MAEVFKGRVVAAEGFEKLVAINRILPDLAGMGVVTISVGALMSLWAPRSETTPAGRRPFPRPSRLRTAAAGSTSASR
jgi:type II secretory pathway component PulM